ncbi:MAG: hypothetical protein ACI9S8_000472 [Chlamydiales bacterium]
MPDYSDQHGAQYAASLAMNIVKMESSFGHSWVELARPIYDDKGQFKKSMEVSSVGFFIIKGMKSPDPGIYDSESKKSVVVSVIKKTDYKKSVKYIQRLSSMINAPYRDWTAVPKGGGLSRKEIREISKIYKSSVKGTCTNFANEFNNTIAGKNHDSRDYLRKTIFPRTVIRYLDRFDWFFESHFLLKKIAEPFAFILGAQIPANMILDQ